MKATFAAAVVAILASTFALPSPAEARTPLLVDGKTTLFQRVIVRNVTSGLDTIRGQEVAALMPMEALYVYADEGEWLELGRSDAAEQTFWARAEDTVAWAQNIVAVLDVNAVTPRVLFFETEDKAFSVIEAEDTKLAAQSLRAAAQEAEETGGTVDGIAALGPDLKIDPQQNFYVMPILDHQDAIFESGEELKLLEVAIARPNRAVQIGTQTARYATKEQREQYSVGIVFVVDTTTSMDPFIFETAELMREVYDRIGASQFPDSYAFGLVGYRDSIDAVPDLDYLSKTFVDLKDGRSGKKFLDGIAEMEVASASSRNFYEDSYQGVFHAVQQLDWQQFDARYIILVTDAGPRKASDRFSETGLSAEGLRNMVRETGGAQVAVMHLKSPGGASNHEAAELAYRALTAQSGGESLYFEITSGDRETYGKRARDIAALIIDQTEHFKFDSNGIDPVIEDFAQGGGGEADAVLSAMRVAGQAFQLQYLGRSEGTEPPDVFRAYVADRDFDRQVVQPIDIRVLMSRSEMSALYQSIELIMEAMAGSLINPDDMFGLVRSAAADMARKPENVGARGNLTLAEETAMDEFLDGLPYTSEVMRFTADDWVSLPVSQQIAFEAGFRERLERYRKYNETPELWVNYLSSGGDNAEQLFALPINDLP